jgi:hypothetical protein
MINANTLRNAKYLLKTSLGVSEDFYTHSELFLLHSCGQGAGNSPGIWCCISSALFDMYETKGHGAEFHSPCGNYTTEIHIIGFVDDTSGSTDDFAIPYVAPLSHYYARATHDAQTWNDILALSGRALQETKCSYHLLFYTFTPAGIPILCGGTAHPPEQI